MTDRIEEVARELAEALNGCPCPDHLPGAIDILRRVQSEERERCAKVAKIVKAGTDFTMSYECVQTTNLRRDIIAAIRHPAGGGEGVSRG